MARDIGYNEVGYKGATTILGNDSGDDGWAPHHVGRPLQVPAGRSGGAAATNPADIQEVPEVDIQPPPRQLDR